MNTIKTLAVLFAAFVLYSCDCEDPGPIQEDYKEYAILDFNELEMGSGLNITVEQGTSFRIRAEGDRRNLNDLEVFKSGGTLIVQFDENDNRRHQTFITIQMPELRKVNFSGGSVSEINGFESDDRLDFILSGGSVAQLDAGYREINLNVSGASLLKMHGLGDVLNADISGASSVNAFDFPVREANMRLTGASLSKVTVSDELDVIASGASAVTYHGNPSVDSELSGASTINKD